MKREMILGVVATLLLGPSVALGDTKSDCLSSASKGQRLRDAHKLVEAREQLRICAAAVCPAAIQEDCAVWLADTEKALPTIVVAAKDAAGADLMDVRVSVDGQLLQSSLDGRAVPINAGPHTFRFETKAGVTREQQVLVLEGEKSQSVFVTLSPIPSPLSPVGAAPAGPVAHDGPPAPTKDETKPAEHSRRGQKVAGLVVGSAGIAGLAVGAIFGLESLGDHGRAIKDCPTTSTSCTTAGASQWADARSAGNVSNVAFIAGGVALAAGTVLWLTARQGDDSAAAVHVGIGPSSILVRGAF